MKSKNLLGKEQNVVLMLLGIILLVLGGLQFISYSVHEKAFMGYETYYYMRLSEQYQETGVTNYDLLQDRKTSFNLFYLMPGTSLIPVRAAARLIPVLMGVLSAFLFYSLLKTLKHMKDERLIATIIFVANPLFLYVFTSFTPLLLAVPLGLAGINCIFRKKIWWAALLLAALPLLSITSTIIFLLAALPASLLDKDKKFSVIIAFLAALLSGIASWIFLGFNPLLELIPSTEALSAVFVELGGIKAYSLIVIGLAVMGILISWQRNARSVATFLFIATSFTFSLFFAETRIFVAMIISVYAGIAIINIINREWNVEQVKNVTLLLILCSIVFSFVVSINSAFSQVNAEKINGIIYLSTSNPEDVMLSAEENGFMIGYLAGRKSFVDGISYKHSSYEEKKEVARTIYYSRDLAVLKETLEDNKINYVLIDYWMRHGGVWTGSDEGVLFLFKHADEFVRIFSNAEVIIYRYVD